MKINQHSTNISLCDGEIDNLRMKYSLERTIKESIETKIDVLKVRSVVEDKSFDLDVATHLKKMLKTNENMKEIDENVIEKSVQREQLIEEKLCLERQLKLLSRKKILMMPVYYFGSLVSVKMLKFVSENILIVEVFKQLEICDNGCKKSIIRTVWCAVLSRMSSFFM